MTGISRNESEEFRRILAERRAQLVIEIRTKLAEARGEVDAADGATSVDGGDRAFLDLAGEVDLAMAERDIMELRDLDVAVERLDNGTFGTCIDCAEAVALARLRAFPTAKRCQRCQTSFEAKHAGAHPTL